MGKFYLTTPLYYVNSKPHIGHAYTEIAADVLARYHRLANNEDVRFLTGTDEHGQKIAKAAAEAGLSGPEFTDKISLTFRELWKTLNISHDDFIRTTEQRHKESVKKVWERLKGTKVGGQDVIYRNTYDGFYCVSCETFIAEGLLDPNAPALCPDCKKPLERMKEETYFFRMSAYQDRLMQDIRQGRLKILPESRRNEVMGFLEHNKLSDLSVSRPKNRLAWGIPVPFDPEHVTYVWFDALINYISAIGYGSDPAALKKWWPADVHIIGKDIIRHHAVIWPALLYALDLELPKMVFAHGWWVVDGEKMSKSRGNVTDPREIVSVYGVDAFRYFLLREAPFGSDGTFSEEALILRYNTDLANDLGNLLHRTLTMCEKYFEGRVPDFRERACVSNVEINALKLMVAGDEMIDVVDAAMGTLAFSEALGAIWDVVGRANKFIEESAPWTLFKEKKSSDLELVILTLTEVLRDTSQAIWPFMPRTAEVMWTQLGLTFPIDRLEKIPAKAHTTFGVKIAKGTPLFPRIETEKKP